METTLISSFSATSFPPISSQASSAPVMIETSVRDKTVPKQSSQRTSQARPASLHALFPNSLDRQTRAANMPATTKTVPMAAHPGRPSLLRKLAQSEREILDTLLFPPTLEKTIPNNTWYIFQHALEQAFPAAPGPLDPNAIYVNTVQVDPITGETTTTSKKLSQILQEFMDSSQMPELRADKVSISYHPEDVTQPTPSLVPGMQDASALGPVLQQFRDDSVSDYQDRYTSFWNKSDVHSTNTTGPSNKAQRLADLWEKQWTMVADLQHLAPSSRDLLSRLDSPSASGKPGVFEILGPERIIGQSTPFSGMFMLTSSPNEDPFATRSPVLLAIPGLGWIECSSGADCKKKLQDIMNDPMQRPALLTHIARADRSFINNLENEIDPVRQSLWFGFRPIAEPLFVNRVQSVLTQQQQDIAYQVEQNKQSGVPIAQAVDQVADLRNAFSMAEVLGQYKNDAAERYASIANTVAKDMPDVRTEARRYMIAQMKTLTGQEVDPDQIWLHRFDTAHSDRKAFSGWAHSGKPNRSQTLTDLALSNFTAADKNAGPGEFNQMSGLYTVGPDSTTGYGVQNEVKLLPSKLMAQNWTKDFYIQYKTKMDDFWKKHQTDYRTMLKGQFIADARAQLTAGTDACTPSDYKLVIGLAGRHTPTETSGTSDSPITLLQLQTESSPNARVHRFDIYGLPSTDILRFYDPQSKNGNTRQILYIPGAKPAFICLNSVAELDAWIVEQAKDPQKRRALEAHFSLYDRQDGATIFGTSGVDSAFQGLADGSWDSSKYIDMQKTVITEDIFTQMAQQIKQRQSKDADTLIRSNGELNKDLWISDISAGEQVLLPIVPLAGPIGLVTAAGGITLLGFGVNKAVNGDTQSERTQGAWTAFDGTLDILFSGGGTVAADDPFAIPGTPVKKFFGMSAIESFDRIRPSQAGNLSAYAVPDRMIAGVNANPKKMYQLAHNWFIRYTDDTNISKVYEIKSNFKLSNNYVEIIDPETRKPQLTLYFSNDGQWKKLGIPGGVRPISTWKLDDATVVFPVDDVKVSTYKLTATSPYSVRFGGINHVVTFDTEAGAWTDKSNAYFWRTKPGQWAQGTLDEFRQAKKIEAHRFLFIDMPPILQIPSAATPIPKEIHYFWAGGEMPANLKNNITLNVAYSSGYKSTVHVDADTPAIFEKMKRDLEGQIPGIQVNNLHDEEAFAPIQKSEMYQYFRQGQGENLAAASDVARYPLMDAHGGIYLDTDDTIMESVEKVILNAMPDDVLVNAPVLHPINNAKSFYNTSNFATQPGNPVIKAIIKEMNERFVKSSSYFKANRPRLPKTSQQYTPKFLTYERKIFDTVGPNMFNDVMKSQIPDRYNVGFFVKNKFFQEALRQRYTEAGIAISPQILQQINNLQITEFENYYTPFARKFEVEIGGEHSWFETR